MPLSRPVTLGLSSLLLLAAAAVTPAFAQTSLDYNGSGQGRYYSYYSTFVGGNSNIGRGTLGSQSFYGADTFFFSVPALPYGHNSFSILASVSDQYLTTDLSHIRGDITSVSYSNGTYTADLTNTSGDGIFDGYKGTGTLKITGLPGPGAPSSDFSYVSSYHLSTPAATVPEPSILAMLGIGAVPLGLIMATRRRRQSA